MTGYSECTYTMQLSDRNISAKCNNNKHFLHCTVGNQLVIITVTEILISEVCQTPKGRGHANWENCNRAQHNPARSRVGAEPFGGGK